MKIKEKAGISLIVLVITILILSILAATVIISLSGTDIISLATDAVDKNNEALLNDKNNLLEAEDIIEEATSGIKVYKTTDSAPGVLEGSGSEEDPYVINSIEDLIFFAYDVKNGNNYSRKNS